MQYYVINKFSIFQIEVYWVVTPCRWRQHGPM